MVAREESERMEMMKEFTRQGITNRCSTCGYRDRDHVRVAEGSQEVLACPSPPAPYIMVDLSPLGPNGKAPLSAWQSAYKRIMEAVGYEDVGEDLRSKKRYVDPREVAMRVEVYAEFWFEHQSLKEEADAQREEDLREHNAEIMRGIARAFDVPPEIVGIQAEPMPWEKRQLPQGGEE